MTSETREDEALFTSGSSFAEHMERLSPTPPPLQPGDAVWVRGKMDGLHGDMAWVRLDGDDTAILSVPLSAIRRIEGEVKP